MKNYTAVLLFSVTISLLSLPASAGLLYGADNGLYSINQTDGTSNLINSGNSSYRLGLAWNPLSNLMYSVGPFNGLLSTVNLLSGATTPVGSNAFQMTGLTFSSDYSTLYSFDFNGGPLLSVNPTTGAAAVIGATGAGLLDMATNSLGTIFGSGDGSCSIHTVDTATGAATCIGGAMRFTAIAFDDSDTLFGIDISGDALYTINTTTGFSTLVGGNIGSDIRGLAFVPDSVAVPSPATLALFGLGLAGLGWSRRKKA